MTRKAWPRMSGANPPVRQPKPAVDARMHLREVQESEIWTACGFESTFNGMRTTWESADVTCGQCRVIIERRRSALASTR